jgi:heptosyltransferase-2
MATPALELLRAALPGSFIGALCRPGIDRVLDDSGLIDEFHVARSQGVMGPKRVADKVRPLRYDTALVFPNSFSTALVTRLAGIPRRFGYEREGRGFLLTHAYPNTKTGLKTYQIISAVTYFWNGALWMLDALGVPIPERFADARAAAERAHDPPRGPEDLQLPRGLVMRVGTSPKDEELADAVFARAGVAGGPTPVLLNPGANSTTKRWPAERFAQVADHIARAHNLPVLLNGSPAELALCESVASACAHARPVILPRIAGDLGADLGTVKAIIRRSRLVVSNDTGPRHLAAALGVPVVTLLGPTDYRWAIIPTHPGAAESVVKADPDLPESVLAHESMPSCSMERIDVPRVTAAVDAALAAVAGRAT